MTQFHTETFRLDAFDGLEVLRYTIDPVAEALGPEALAAFAAFQARGKAVLAEAAPHLFAYAKSFGNALGWDQIDMAEPETDATIWNHVRLTDIDVDQAYGEGPHYVSLSGGCDWEVEHGVHLTWRNGTELAFVGPFDGHMVNDGYGTKPAMERVVYHCPEGRFTTTREG